MTESTATNTNNSLRLIIYSSVAADDLNPEEIDQLVEGARTFNASQMITGVLVYADQVFMQVLEGDSSALQPLYDRIKQDKRHHTVVTLMDCPLDKRRFSDWSMGFENSIPNGSDGLVTSPSANVDRLFESQSGLELATLMEELELIVEPSVKSQA